ncbi:MAG TPA: hypothetical protein VN381_10140 [Anaerovoracaceae bacterium]|nr:hypothetical protein [Anaerovoracaceae bacterium]
MNYVKYNRAFVMLEEQNGQFAAKESAPAKGYLKVETGNNKGALRCIVQNLRYFEKGDYIYKLILFGKKGERTIHTIIGNLVINRQGNGETYFRFLPLDIDGKGNAYHNYTTAIIAAASTKDGKEPLHPVLKGVTFSEVEPFQSELFPVDEALEEGQSFEKEDIIDKINKIVNDLEGTLRDERFSAESDIEEDVIPEFHQSEAAFVPREKGEESVSKKTYNEFYNEYILNACAHTCRIAEFYEDVTPFDRDRTGAKWKKMVNITNLPLVSPGAHYFATQYRHYIFGAKPDENGMATQFFFGIPGRFLDEEQPDGGRSGFTYWQPIRGADPVFEGYRKEDQSSRNAYGYWIVAIDGKTGNIEEV